MRKKDNVDAQVGENINIEDTMDYRYFYMSNKNYYDELARMSLIMSNAVSNGNGGVDTNEETKEMKFINTAMQSIGMTCEYSDVSKDNFIAGLAIGHNEVEYYNIKKNIVLIVISNARNVVEYSSFADIGKSVWSTTLNSNHSKAHEILANEVYNRINTYLTTHNINENVVYWVTGYGTGGGIANLLSEKLIDNPPISTNIVIDKDKKFLIFTYGKEKVSVPTGMTNVYTYTFGAPYTVYNYEGQAINTVESKYCSIMNVVNESDIYSYIMPQKLGWSRYGMTCVKQEKKYNVVTNFIHNTFNNDKPIKNDRVLVESDIETIFNSSGKMNTFRSSYYDNYDKKNIDEYIMHEIFKGMRNNTLDSVIQHIDRNEWTNDITRRNNYRVLAKHLKENNQAFKNAKNLSVYYNISKYITPNDVTFRVSSDTTFRGYEASQDYKTAVRKMMEWYVSHVATYQHSHRDGTTYALGSVEAEEYYNRFNLQNYVGVGGNASFLYARDVEWLNQPESDVVIYRDFGGRGLYYCQSYADRMNQAHRMLGDDCSGFMMAVIGYYAGDSLKDNDYYYVTDNKGDHNFQINDIGTSTVGDYTRKIADWLSTQAQIYVYEVTNNTTENDLEFGDFVLTTSGHVEMYIDANHTWGWGMKHCTMYDKNSNLGWEGSFKKDNNTNYFKWSNRRGRKRNNNNIITNIDDGTDSRQYRYVISPNPNKQNMTPKFNVRG